MKAAEAEAQMLEGVGRPHSSAGAQRGFAWGRQRRGHSGLQLELVGQGWGGAAGWRGSSHASWLATSVGEGVLGYGLARFDNERR